MKKVLILLLILTCIFACSKNESKDLNNTDEMKKTVSLEKEKRNENYVPKKMLSLTEKGYLWTIANSGLRVRESSNLSSPVVTVIPYGSKVKVLEQKNEEIFLAGEYGYWTKIVWNNYTGWVFSGFLRDFNINNLKKNIANELNNYYNGEGADIIRSNSHLQVLQNNSIDDIEIVKIVGNILLIKEPGLSDLCPELASIYNVYTMEKSKLKIIASGYSKNIIIGFFNNDSDPEIIIPKGNIKTDFHLYVCENGKYKEVQLIETEAYDYEPKIVINKSEIYIKLEKPDKKIMFDKEKNRFVLEN